MTTLIVILHLIVCILLIMVVMLQAGKGADMVTTFGAGTSQTVFGSGGAAPFLTKLTTVVAVIFMVTSIFLTIMGARQTKKSVVSGVSAVPAEQDKALPEPEAFPEKTDQQQNTP